jgi:hypothetical protein
MHVTEWIRDEPVDASDEADLGGCLCANYDDRHPDTALSIDDAGQALASYAATGC